MATVCVKCQVSYKVVEIGAFVVETFGDPPRPYKIWAADLLRCPGCGTELLITGTSPLERLPHGAALRLAEINAIGKAKIFYWYEEPR